LDEARWAANVSYPVAPYRCRLTSPMDRPCGRALAATDLLLAVLIFLQQFTLGETRLQR
jgi:hypothetical protein